MRSEIWWGDVIRAAEAMGDATDGFDAVAAALGLGPRTPSGDQPPATAGPAPSGAQRRDQDARPDDPVAAAPERPAPQAGAPLPGRVLVPVASEPIGAGLAAGPVLARPAAARAGGPRPHQPLLAPRTTGAILQYLLSAEVREGPPDVAAAVELAARGEPLTALPRTAQPTLRFGTQVLVDLGVTMRPFRRDQLEIVRGVQAVAGRAATTVGYFDGAPLRGTGSGGVWTWRAYEPPPARTRVLLLTDFGIGTGRLSPGRPPEADWVTFLELLRRNDCVPVALVPYPPARWPVRLRAHCAMLMWDRHVTVGHAKAAVS